MVWSPHRIEQQRQQQQQQQLNNSSTTHTVPSQLTPRFLKGACLVSTAEA
jgi:hypothetical protein